MARNRTDALVLSNTKQQLLSHHSGLKKETVTSQSCKHSRTLFVQNFICNTTVHFKMVLLSKHRVKHVLALDSDARVLAAGSVVSIQHINIPVSLTKS